MSEHEVNRFALWSHENLAEYAKQATEKLNQQDREIEQLREDLRAAIDAYRALVRRVG